MNCINACWAKRRFELFFSLQKNCIKPFCWITCLPQSTRNSLTLIYFTVLSPVWSTTFLKLLKYLLVSRIGWFSLNILLKVLISFYYRIKKSTCLLSIIPFIYVYCIYCTVYIKENIISLQSFVCFSGMVTATLDHERSAWENENKLPSDVLYISERAPLLYIQA